MFGRETKKSSRLPGSNATGKMLATETSLTSRGNYSTRCARASVQGQVFGGKTTFKRQDLGLSSFIFSLNVSRFSLITLVTHKSLSEKNREGRRSYIRDKKLNDRRIFRQENRAT